MSNIIYLTILLVMAVSLLKAALGQICTKQIVVRYDKHKQNPDTQRLTKEEATYTTIIEVCCEGYQNIGEPMVMPPKCVPICHPPCDHGNCSSPNTCSCDPGYKRSELGTCVVDDSDPTQPLASVRLVDSPTKRNALHNSSDPICDPPCGHGICYTTNTCACDEGYVHSELGACVVDESAVTQPSTSVRSVESPTKRTTLFSSNEPSCDPPCGHGLCFLENTCACDEGYMHSDLGSCVLDESAVTQPSTTTSATESPVHANASSANVSKCGPCLRGTCLLNTFCICPSGYGLVERNCEPICSMSCLNGRCIAPNKCECEDGYTIDNDSLQCKPMCNGKIDGCIHGTCVGYNQCHCDNGTFLHKDEFYRCISDVPMAGGIQSWLWYLLCIPLTAAIIVISFYFIMKFFKAKRFNDEHEMYIFSNSTPSADESYQLDSEKNEYTKGELSLNEGIFRRNGNVVIINT